MDSKARRGETRRLTVVGGVAMAVSAIFGAGLLVLPASAAGVAGPSSLLGWLLLVACSIPVAFTFAALGGRYPGSGGVATFANRAFGPHVQAVAGYGFYFALPLGAPATALIGARYVGEALGITDTASVAAMAAVLLAVAIGVNWAGLTMSSRLQVACTALLIAVLLAAIVIAAPRAQVSNLVPFAPAGLSGVFRATSLLFFSFAGWEALSHLSGAFRSPQRDLPRVSRWSVGITAVVYLALAATATLVLGDRLPGTPIPLTALLGIGIGTVAVPITGVIAATLTVGAMTAYLAGASRLGSTLASEQLLPRWISASDSNTSVRRSLGLLTLLCACSLVATALLNVDLDVLLRGASASFAAVTVIGLAAGIRLLSRGSKAWWMAVAATAVMTGVLLTGGVYLLLPVGTATFAVVLSVVRKRRCERDQSPHTRT